MKKNEEKGKNIIIGILALIIVVLAGLCVYLLFIKNDDRVIDSKNNIENKGNDTTSIDDNIVKNVYGTYYNSDYSEVYFTLNSNNTAIVVASTCSNGVFPSKTVAYKIVKENDKILLSIDINNNQKYESVYTGYETNGELRFKPNSLGCADGQDTYYGKK